MESYPRFHQMSNILPAAFMCHPPIPLDLGLAFAPHRLTSQWHQGHLILFSALLASRSLHSHFHSPTLIIKFDRVSHGLGLESRPNDRATSKPLTKFYSLIWNLFFSRRLVWLLAVLKPEHASTISS